MAEAKRAAEILLDEDGFVERDELTGFAARLVADLMRHHTHAEWFYSHGEVARLTTETQGSHRVFAAYVGPEDKRFYFGLANCH
ncbi:hypothetical protein CCAX7_60530 [Capsulimonas corticalis]|uniref:Uncharacterized protein n=1 Tax=Capsulimonas corticalis TaxID=2219043 RepID=A0A402CW09_9BACT|nr:hypothetical protein [Capsulimonas corticalis]BDI34002.1 hypothetical protein CCAX7_60530 [Capsulimonas corticalis]